ncbi:hypothetical protein [Cellvibrio sp. QJXJ]|uniref:hypothetical protein n=1 Tax=Cellvibrio sp. QJXJ TaxID=2964606 RepID=UPI0021C396E8|nr:hypothetical protein [Cellvibrio sp. QJXJ]UUA75232.1 hypothetical protein NNX04_22500 [Cellvibrio sp. QJXJ]
MKAQPLYIVNFIEWLIGAAGLAVGFFLPFVIAWLTESYFLSCIPFILLLAAFFVFQNTIPAIHKACDRGARFSKFKLDPKQGLIAMGGIVYGLIISIITTLLSFSGIALSVF